MPVVSVALGLVYLAAVAGAKPASEWVSDARAADGFTLNQKITIEVAADCSYTMMQANQAIDVLDLQSGMGHIISICSTEDTGSNPHYFTAEEFFASSALRKYQTEFGYGKAHQLLACESFSGTCCDMYVVPVIPGEYQAFDNKCENVTFPIMVTGDASATLENPALPMYTPLTARPAEVQGALSSSWPGWADATSIEVLLVEGLCDEHDQAHGEGSSRRLLEEEEALKLSFMYSGGHSGVNSSLFEFATGSAGLFGDSAGAGEGEGEGEGVVAIEGEEGEGAARRLLAEGAEGAEGSKAEDDHVEAVDAGMHPIEMVVNNAYIIRFALFRVSLDAAVPVKCDCSHEYCDAI